MADAKTECANANLGGTGWRLPTLKELQSLVDYSLSPPTTRGGYRMHPREMIAEVRDNGQLDWSHFLVVEEGNDVTPPLSNRRLDSTRRPTDLE